MTTPLSQVPQPLLAPIATGGGIVAGVSAALVGLYQLGDCLAYKVARGECDRVVSTAVPAIVAGVGSLVGAAGGLWTYNPALRTTNRKRDSKGRYIPDDN